MTRIQEINGLLQEICMKAHCVDKVGNQSLYDFAGTIAELASRACLLAKEESEVNHG